MSDNFKSITTQGNTAPISSEKTTLRLILKKMSNLQHVRFTLSWSVDTTVSKAITFGTDLIRACTTDNVQPLALLVCENSELS
jgi:hypothetical protein